MWPGGSAKPPLSGWPGGSAKPPLSGWPGGSAKPPLSGSIFGWKTPKEGTIYPKFG